MKRKKTMTILYLIFTFFVMVSFITVGSRIANVKKDMKKGISGEYFSVLNELYQITGVSELSTDTTFSEEQKMAISQKLDSMKDIMKKAYNEKTTELKNNIEENPNSIYNKLDYLEFVEGTIKPKMNKLCETNLEEAKFALNSHELFQIMGPATNAYKVYDLINLTHKYTNGIVFYTVVNLITIICYILSLVCYIKINSEEVLD